MPFNTWTELKAVECVNLRLLFVVCSSAVAFAKADCLFLLLVEMGKREGFLKKKPELVQLLMRKLKNI